MFGNATDISFLRLLVQQRFFLGPGSGGVRTTHPLGTQQGGSTPLFCLETVRDQEIFSCANIVENP